DDSHPHHTTVEQNSLFTFHSNVDLHDLNDTHDADDSTLHRDDHHDHQHHDHLPLHQCTRLHSLLRRCLSNTIQSMLPLPLRQGLRSPCVPNYVGHLRVVLCV